MALVLDWHNATERPEAIRRAVDALSQGELVAFPTETVYGLAASAHSAEAVDKLRHGKGRAHDKPLTLALSSAARAVDWVPGMSRIGRRLASRNWPGPLTLVFDSGIDEGLLRWLPESVRQRGCPNGT